MILCNVRTGRGVLYDLVDMFALPMRVTPGVLIEVANDDLGPQSPTTGDAA